MILNWVKAQKPGVKGVNIITSDFVELVDFAATVIALNDLLLEEDESATKSWLLHPTSASQWTSSNYAILIRIKWRLLSDLFMWKKFSGGNTVKHHVQPAPFSHQCVGLSGTGIAVWVLFYVCLWLCVWLSCAHICCGICLPTRGWPLGQMYKMMVHVSMVTGLTVPRCVHPPYFSRPGLNQGLLLIP